LAAWGDLFVLAEGQQERPIEGFYSAVAEPKVNNTGLL
jgi:hypothetical protein